MNYSVLLMYPDGDTYFTHVTAPTPRAARDAALAQACQDALYEPSDFELLLLFEGYATDLSYRLGA